MKKRILCMLLALVMVFTTADLTVFAQDIVSVSEEGEEESPDSTEQTTGITTLAISSGSGTIENGKEEGIAWSIDTNGVLRVTGKGEIAEDNLDGAKIPWSGLNFTSAVIELSEIRDLSYLFSGCKQLKSVDLSKLDTSQVTDMSYMF